MLRGTLALTGAVIFSALLTAPTTAHAATMPAAKFSGNFTVLACNGGKSATLKQAGTVNLAQSCKEGSGSVTATAARTHFSVTMQQTATGGTSTVSDSGAVGATLFFEVIGPAGRKVPVKITFSGSLAGSSSQAASGILLETAAKPVQYSCGVTAGTVLCGSFTKTVTIKLQSLKKITPAQASPVAIDAIVQGVSDSGGGAQTSSVTGAVTLAIPPSFKHASKYKLVLSPGVAN